MSEIIRIGVDLAKLVFQMHGVDAADRALLRRQVKRAQFIGFLAQLPPCLVVMEACGSAHHWARRIAALGHEVRLVPAAYVKPYVKRNKNDAIDAEAICEAGGRASMRFVPVKSAEAQAVGMLHGTRQLLVKMRTMQVNALRGHLAEFGLIAAKGIEKLPVLAALVEETPADALPEIARSSLRALLGGIHRLDEEIAGLEAELKAWHRGNEVSRRLAEIPGIGLMTATALAVRVVDPGLFRNGRDLAAWVGLTPRQDSTGGRTRLGRITKAGDALLRRLLMLGATSLIRSLKTSDSALGRWVRALLARRPPKVVAIALANKLARIAWVVMARGEPFDPRRLEAAAGAA